jgi:hypothetical protein
VRVAGIENMWLFIFCCYRHDIQNYDMCASWRSERLGLRGGR